MEEFVDKFTEKVAIMKGGLPWEIGVDLTPLPEPDKPTFIAELISDAVGKGAKCITPGNDQHLGYTFVAPSILCPVNKDMRVWHEEQFGPLVPIAPFIEHSEVQDQSTEYCSLLHI